MVMVKLFFASVIVFLILPLGIWAQRVSDTKVIEGQNVSLFTTQESFLAANEGTVFLVIRLLRFFAGVLLVLSFYSFLKYCYHWMVASGAVEAVYEVYDGWVYSLVILIISIAIFVVTGFFL